MNSASERPRTSSRLWVRTTSVEAQASKSRGELPKGNLLLPPAVMTKVYGPFCRICRIRLPGLVRGNEHNIIIRAMKTYLGFRFAGRDKLVHLIGLGEVVARLGRSVADRLHGAVQIREGFPDGNQAVSFTLHGFILPCPSDKTGTPCHPAHYGSSCSCCDNASVPNRSAARGQDKPGGKGLC